VSEITTVRARLTWTKFPKTTIESKVNQAKKINNIKIKQKKRDEDIAATILQTAE